MALSSRPRGLRNVISSISCPSGVRPKGASVKRATFQSWLRSIVLFDPVVGMDVDIALDLRAELGEGPVWDVERQRLLFVNILHGEVHAFDPSTGEDAIFH